MCLGFCCGSVVRMRHRNRLFFIFSCAVYGVSCSTSKLLNLGWLQFWVLCGLNNLYNQIRTLFTGLRFQVVPIQFHSCFLYKVDISIIILETRLLTSRWPLPCLDLLHSCWWCKASVVVANLLPLSGRLALRTFREPGHDDSASSWPQLVCPRSTAGWSRDTALIETPRWPHPIDSRLCDRPGLWWKRSHDDQFRWPIRWSQKAVARP